MNMKSNDTAADIVQQDLEHIRASAAEELAQLAGRRLLITGGAGFLGYYLVQTITHFNATRSAGRPVDLTVFDNFSRGIPSWLRGLGSKLNLVRHDVRHPLPADMGHFDFIIHAASIASPTIYRLDPIGTMDANVNGLRALLEYFKGQKEAGRPVGGFLFYSSSEIYGDPDAANIPTPESYRGCVSCTGPRACYDEAKRYGETLCVNFARQHGLPVKSARPFNNYGPGLRITDGRVIPDFARDVLAGRDIVMLSDGRATRTFCYSADAVAGYYKVLVRGRAGEAYNIGVEKPEISMAQLGEKITALGADLYGYRGKVVRKSSGDADYLVDNPNRRCPIIDKARRELGYEPKIDLDEGLRRSMVWYGDNREGMA
ncbi:MAG: NAD-dependent epimerase/dehydratase family protein [Phycisphaerales bacterium]|nr:NAD-dependent epimerase/dehydratase family protein [Phycisphaerales bacterium]